MSKQSIKPCRLFNLSCKFFCETGRENKRLINIMNESDVIKYIFETTNKTDVFFDIGANIGTHTCFFGKYYTPENVHAFEPHPATFKRLCQNIDLNTLDCHLHNIALGDENTKKDFYELRDILGEGRHAFVRNPDGPLNPNKLMQVKCHKLDTLISQEKLPKPDAIKIDVEGAEFKVLSGMEKVLEKKNNIQLFIELHPQYLKQFGSSVEELKDFIRNKNLKFEKIKQRKREYFIRCFR